MYSKDNIEYLDDPEELDEQLYLTSLIEVETLQRIQDAFSKMARMAALTTDAEGVAVTKGSNFSEFCSEFCRKSPIGKARCENCDKMGAVMALNEKKPVSYFCHAHLVDYAAPIMLGDRMIGSFIGGQVLSEEPDYDKMRRIAREIEVDEEAFVKAAQKTSIVEKDAIDRAATFIYEYAGILSDMAYKAYHSKQLSKEAILAASQKSDFLANMSHEIRTPMNAILGMTEMALREDMSPTAKEYLHQIKSSGKNLLVIINDILDFSKIESGKMDIIEVSYEPMSLIMDISSIINSRIGNKEIEFTMDIPCNMPRRLLGDSVRIQQILVNLLNNAVKFTKQGEVNFKLEFIPVPSDDKSVILKASVRDTGMGIKKEDFNKLFKSFQQVDSKRNRNIEGTGLGLAISQQLLKLMKGKISVQSTYEKGSTFSLELPQKLVNTESVFKIPEKAPKVSVLVRNVYLKKQLLKSLSDINAEITDISDSGSFDNMTSEFFITEKEQFNSTLENYAAEHSDIKFIVIDKFNAISNIKLPNVRIVRKPVYSLALYTAMGLAPEFVREDSDDEEFQFIAPDAHILIVDDNSVNLTVASGLLEPLNMKIDLASNAEQAIEKVDSFMYDLIFMDHMMPEVDGIDVTHIIRRLIPRYADVPIIALTANAVEGVKEMFLKEGMNDFVAKPIELREILSKLRKWLPQEKIIPVENGVSVKKTASENTPEVAGLNTKSAIAMLGSESLFRKVLQEYYCTIENKAAVIRNYWESGNIKKFTIEVHALKSASRQIGAERVSDLAARLERAGNENDKEFIDNNTEELLNEYIKYKELLRPQFPEVEAAEEKKEASAEKISAMLGEMLEAIGDMDTLRIDDVIEEMSGYEFEDLQKKYFENLKSAAENFDTDLCADITNEWLNEIK